MGNLYQNKSFMKTIRKFFLIVGFSFFLFNPAFNQTFDENGELIYNIYKLPSLEVSAGVMTFFGDVNDFNRNIPFVGKHNFGLGFTINQRIGSFFGLKAGYSKGTLTGFDTRPGSYYNFQSDATHAHFNISLHLDNDIIFNKSSRFAPYITAGIGYFTFDPMGDIKDKNGSFYHYWRDGTIRDQAFDPENPQNGNHIVRDYVFETKLDSLNLNSNTALTIPVGGGVKFKLSDALEASLDLTYVFTNNNFVDNMASENKSYPFFDRRNDNFLYSSVSLQFNIGGFYKQILNNKPYRNINFAEIDAMDIDGDGIRDHSDKCPNTPKGVKTDEMGCPVDDDADGVPNYLDKELGTLPGAVVDENGVTITPEMIEAKYIRDSLLMAGELILEKKYSDGTPIITEDYSTSGGTVYSHVTYPYVAANWPENVKSIPVRTSSGSKTKTSTSASNSRKTPEVEHGNVMYKVQIGASQKPLDVSFFNEKFGITEDISIEQTDSWYRYTVGNFRSYKAAREYLNTQSRVEGAFIVKYENGQRVVPTGITTTDSNEYTTHTTATTTTTTTYVEPSSTQGICFRVQIGSSANKLSPNFFKDNFGITEDIYEEQVDGQYKYTVGYFKTYQEARKHSEKITSVQGAFVTAYKDGKRIPLQDAINAVE